MQALNAKSRRLIGAALAVVTLGTAPLAVSHLVDEEPMQSYRQSYFTLLAMNFGPIAGMLKGDMPWDDAKVVEFANTFAAIAGTDVTKAFPPGSDKGTTRAKPEIWENTEDFAEKFANLQKAALGLKAAAATGDKATIGEAVKATGGACKACHDEYKAKNYLY